MFGSLGFWVLIPSFSIFLPEKGSKTFDIAKKLESFPLIFFLVHSHSFSLKQIELLFYKHCGLLKLCQDFFSLGMDLCFRNMLITLKFFQGKNRENVSADMLSLVLMEKVVQASLDYSSMLCPVGSYST